ncbi:MAG: four helix bundle protein [Planctomycetes bacterium]|nr:four helix bundle protein [Planctomycetota bacterium]
MDEQGRNRQGYEKLIVWQNAAKLRRLVYQATARFPAKECRRVSQMNDAARSVKQNIQEGYKRLSLGEYIYFLGISHSSLGELMGDWNDCFEDSLINEAEFRQGDELIGKTDYLFKRLIQSLQRKAADEKQKKSRFRSQSGRSPNGPGQSQAQNG